MSAGGEGGTSPGGGGASMPGLPRGEDLATVEGLVDMASPGKIATAPGGMLTGRALLLLVGSFCRSRLGGGKGAPVLVLSVTIMLWMSLRGAGTGGISVAPAADTPPLLDMTFGSVVLCTGDSDGDKLDDL